MPKNHVLSHIGTSHNPGKNHPAVLPDFYFITGTIPAHGFGVALRNLARGAIEIILFHAENLPQIAAII